MMLQVKHELTFHLNDNIPASSSHTTGRRVRRGREWGKKVYETITQYQNIDVSWLEQGLYYVRVIDSSEIPWNTSFVKIK